jgi:chemotaxis protein histidine kinase CheA
VSSSVGHGTTFRLHVPLSHHLRKGGGSPVST